jgi:phosphotransferase system  glucose/maltose/N-acetylglucosamine-specific IIC component
MKSEGWEDTFVVSAGLVAGSVIGFIVSVWFEKHFPKWDSSISQRNAIILFGVCVVVMIISGLRGAYLKDQERKLIET